MTARDRVTGSNGSIVRIPLTATTGCLLSEVAARLAPPNNQLNPPPLAVLLDHVRE